MLPVKSADPLTGTTIAAQFKNLYRQWINVDSLTEFGWEQFFIRMPNKGMKNPGPHRPGFLMVQVLACEHQPHHPKVAES